MGRAPCCDKANVKKGPWSPEEDAKLKSYIEKHGTGGNWIALPQKIGLKRCGKSCRLRWLNYLRPNLKHGGFSEEEDNIICSLYVSIGSRWSVIAAQLPGRTDNDIKNYWNTKLKKKLLGKHRREPRNRGNYNNTVNQESTDNKERVGSGDSSLSLVQEISGNTHQQQQQLCWPLQTLLPYTNQQGACFNDQDSIKKLLMKLGGRFSSDYDNYHPTLDVFNFQFSQGQQMYQEKVHVGSSNSSLSSTTHVNNNEAQFNGVTVNVNNLVQGQQGGFVQAIHGEMVASSNYSDGLEFLYGEGIIDHKIIGSSSVTTNWGEISTSTSTPICHDPLIANSNYQGQGVRSQECALQEFSYPGAH